MLTYSPARRRAALITCTVHQKCCGGECEPTYASLMALVRALSQSVRKALG